MKPSRILPMLAFSSLVMTNCKMNRPEMDGTNSSKLADVAIVELNRSGWNSFDFKLERLRPTTETVQSSHQKVEGQSITAKAKVLYGDYKMLLTYKDAQGKAVYESCPDEKAKEHSIRVPLYSVTVVICPIGSSNPVGVVVGDGADVVIKPDITVPGGKTPDAPAPATPGSFVAQATRLWTKTSSPFN
jgi:hypothetical protein